MNLRELNKLHELNEVAHIQVECEQCGLVKRRCLWYGGVTVPPNQPYSMANL